MRTVFRRRLKLRFFGLESGNEMRSSLPFASFFLFILFRVFDLAGDLREETRKEKTTRKASVVAGLSTGLGKRFSTNGISPLANVLLVSVCVARACFTWEDKNGTRVAVVF